MRYVGQGHEIPVPLATPVGDVASIRAAYDAAYAAFYDRPVPGSDVEIMSYAVTVATAPFAGPGSTRPVASPGATRIQRLRDTATGDVADWPVHDRASMTGDVAGPAIVAEDETSTLVGPGWQARILADGSIDMRRT